MCFLGVVTHLVIYIGNVFHKFDLVAKVVAENSAQDVYRDVVTGVPKLRQPRGSASILVSSSQDGVF